MPEGEQTPEAAARDTPIGTKPAARELDPTLMAVLAHRFEAIVREMTNTLFRTGRSSIQRRAPT